MNEIGSQQQIEESAEDISSGHPLFREAPQSGEFNKLRKRLVRLTREAIEKFSMVRPGDRWLVALSGGKDSYGLLAILLDLKWRGLLPVDLLIRTGACMAIMGVIAHASQRVVRLPRVFSAVAQETLVIYFFHLCVIYGSAWSYGLLQFYGASLGPWQTGGIVAALVLAMSAMAWWWNWLKHTRPKAARYTALAGCVILVGGILF